MGGYFCAVIDISETDIYGLANRTYHQYGIAAIL